MKALLQDIRVISFDLDETLWPTMKTIVAAERELYAWMQQHVPALVENQTIDSLRRHRRELAEQHPHLAHDMNLTRVMHLELLLEQHGYDTAQAQVAVDYFQHFRNHVYPYPDVIPALEQLREHYTLVSVTNGTTEVDKTPLQGQFVLNLNAVDAGKAKPHPAIFHKVMQQTGVEPHQLLHVGDDPLRDVEPARQLGIRTIWVNRNEDNWPLTVQPADAAIKSLQELV